MLGFLVLPATALASQRARSAIANSVSLTVTEVHQIGEYEAIVYSNGQGNDYRYVDPDDRTLIAAGTIILGRKRGVHALEHIAARTAAGKSLKDVYGDLRGPFNLLIVDRRTQTVSLLSDREGLMCCFRAEVDRRPLYCSNLLLLAGLVGPELDSHGVQEFVHGGGCINGRTLFQRITRLAAATWVQVHPRSLVEETLWKPTIHCPSLAHSDAEIVDRMHAMFSQSVDVELLDDDKCFGTDLTAGTDSRTVLSFLLRTGTRVTASTSGDTTAVDVVTAQRIAQKAGIEHFLYGTTQSVVFDQAMLALMVELADGGMNPFGLTHQVPYLRQRTQRFDILFGGNGGPLFKDHYWLFEFNRIAREREPDWHRIAKYSLTEGRVNDALFLQGIDYWEYMANAFAQCSQKIAGTNNQKLDFVYMHLKGQAFAAPQFSLTNRFLDVYHPMVDWDLVQYSLSIRPWIRQRARLQAELIYRNSPAIAWILTDNFVPCVPDTGSRVLLRSLRAIRYVRALQRKLLNFGFDRRSVSRDDRAPTLVASLRSTDLIDVFHDPSRLSFADLVNLREIERMRDAAQAGINSSYLQRILAVEAFYRHARRL